jgi:hypothetical protein
VEVHFDDLEGLLHDGALLRRQAAFAAFQVVLEKVRTKLISARLLDSSFRTKLFVPFLSYSFGQNP